MTSDAASAEQTLDRAFQQAVELHRAGRLPEAEQLYQAILQVQPAHAEANHNMGVLAVQANQPAAGLQYFMAALEANPAHGQYWLSYSDALLKAGQAPAAREVLEMAQRQGLQGEEVDALSAHIQAAMDGNKPQASAPGKNAPGQQEINALAALFNAGKHAEAERLAREMTQHYPRHGFGWKVLGALSKQMGRNEEALAFMQKAVKLSPDDAHAHNNLGFGYHDLGRMKEAEASYRRALQLRPDLAEAHNNLGMTLQETGRLDEAVASYRRALQLKPDYIEALSNLGAALQDTGQLGEAENYYRRALAIRPDDTTAHSNLLFLLNYKPGSDPAVGIAEARRYGEKVSVRASSRFAEWTCEKQPKRLSIGWVSGDFRNHPVGYFLENLLKHLDREAFELIAYPTARQEDELTTRIKPYFSSWTPLYGLSDEAAAKLIHADGLHILIDLSGHTRHNRLPLFAWKPAPVQASWLGYFATTGVTEIDYLIADPWTLPETEERYFTEKIWRLPETRLCFSPPDIEVAVSPLPAQANGHLTFGCFNTLAKVNDEVVALWSRVLKEIPDSRMYLKAKQLGEDSARRRIAERFAAHGIPAERLILEGPEAREQYLAAYRRVDIVLDTFPFPGGTTSVEALWMGVPVLTLSGRSFLFRQGVGLLANAGLREWIADDADDYVRRAAAHAADLEALARLREGLRTQVVASPVMDGQRFARHFGEALRGMWRERQN
jgi:predicted O-linked N-acetylglucosamine transferase (SPINDLY family)